MKYEIIIFGFSVCSLRVKRDKSSSPFPEKGEHILQQNQLSCIKGSSLPALKTKLKTTYWFSHMAKRYTDTLSIGAYWYSFYWGILTLFLSGHTDTLSIGVYWHSFYWGILALFLLGYTDTLSIGVYCYSFYWGILILCMSKPLARIFPLRI